MSNADIQARGYIYRFVEFHRAAEIFEQESLFFARPSQWQDPYEVRIKHAGAESLFAQCWCQTAMTEAMWRIYSPHGTAVRIRTTKTRLRHAVSAWTAANGHGCRVGKVSYLDPAQIRRFYHKVGIDLAGLYSHKRASDALFKKREAFGHENEFRVVLTCENINREDKGISVSVNPHELIDQVVLDPRAPKQLVDALALYFKVQLDFKGEVRASSLYKRPADIIVL